MSAFAMGEANRGKEPMVFDWDRAAKIIRESGCSEARAGLRGDWGYTGGPIYENSAPVPADETYTFLSSTWAKPEIEVDGRRQSCYRMQREVPDWDSGTYWPESARKILAEEEELG